MLLDVLRRDAPLVILALCASLNSVSAAQSKAEVVAPTLLNGGKAKATGSKDAVPVSAKAAPANSRAKKANNKNSGSTKAASEPKVALGGDSRRTRFLIGLDKYADFQVFSLANPNRVIVDVSAVALQLPKHTAGKAVGLVRAFRGGISAPGKSRVVIDVTAAVVVESAKIEKAKGGKRHYLALEIVPVETATKTARKKKPFKVAPYSLGAAGLQPPLPLPAVNPKLSAAKSFKPVIVIDPGHGGHDSGAKKNGVVEKEVVLAFSKVLKKKIEATGRYRVHLTRDSDVFIKLGKRVKIAERLNANLFIAVHADYAGGNSSARGATIYSLRDSVARSLKRSAKGDASADVLSEDEVETVKMASVDGDLAAVKSILSDLAVREVEATHKRTDVFSRSVVDFMGASTHMRNDPSKQAGFRVLKTALFPSVLIELAYVTNKKDAELLQSDAWRNKVSDSIMTAVESYFSNQVARLPL
jgi:N-acetylmuramoyl-L-alanine amidase